jgi:hypothetical protein
VKKVFGDARAANVMALLALFVALGGTSYAALSITGTNVKNNSLTGADIKNNSVATADVKNGSLLSRDFRAGQLPKGATGAQGAQGPKGDKGDPGTNGTNGANGANGATNVVVRRGILESVANGTVGVVTAECQPGERATGWGNSISGSAGWQLIEAFPTPSTEGATPTGYRVDALNGTGAANNLVAFVICAAP